MIIMLFVSMLLIVMIIVVIIVLFVVMIIMIVVSALAELDRRDAADRFVHWHAIVLGGLDDVEEAFLKGRAIDDHRLGFTDCGHLLGRCLEVVGVRTDRHDRDDVHLVANDVRDDVTEDVCADHNGWCISWRIARRHRSVASAGCSDEREHGEKGNDGVAGEPHETLQSENQYQF